MHIIYYSTNIHIHLSVSICIFGESVLRNTLVMMFAIKNKRVQWFVGQSDLPSVLFCQHSLGYLLSHTIPAYTSGFLY